MPETARLRIRVSPGAAADQVAGRYGNAWKVRVSAAPEHGRANDAVVDLLAKRLALPRGNVSVIRGHGSRDKVVELRGLGLEEAERRLDAHR